MFKIGRLTAWLLAVLWLPVTMHCKLELLPSLKFLACCQHQNSAPHQDSDCDEDICATVESGAYLIQANPSFIIPPILGWVISALNGPDETGRLPEPRVCLGNRAPPRPPKPWQFSHRAAFPPRAPSSVA